MDIGLERLAANPEWAADWGNCMLVANQASVTREYIPSWQICREILGDRLVGFLGPQHGFHATVQDNMIETKHGSGPYGLPVYSLYSETRQPSEQMLEGVDTILIDLQLVGCRVYTFKYTIAGCIRAAKAYNKRVVILDRPNPLGGKKLEGRVLSPDVYSFVGEFSIPLRHGLSVAEAARFFARSLDANVEWVSMDQWNPSHYWGDLERPWVLTSPNLPSLDSLYAYPATVMLEACNLSEGRGTGLPFQFVGAPYIKSSKAFIERILHYFPVDGVYLREAEFEPTSSKWQAQTCRGLQIHFTDVSKFRSFPFGLAVIRAAMDLGGKSFQWKQPPYEYEYEKPPINLIAGDSTTLAKFEADDFNVLDGFWHEGLESYRKQAEYSLLYPRVQSY